MIIWLSLIGLLVLAIVLWLIFKAPSLIAIERQQEYVWALEDANEHYEVYDPDLEREKAKLAKMRGEPPTD